MNQTGGSVKIAHVHYIILNHTPNQLFLSLISLFRLLRR